MTYFMNKSKSRPLQPVPENYNFGFVILCPEKNINWLRNTALSIKKSYPLATIVGVVGNDATPEELEKMGTVCEMVQGHDTITSLMNVGIKNSKSPWNVLVFAGSWVKPSVYKHFDFFVKGERDILFPVVDGRYNFVDGSMNGIIIHKKSLELAGDFPTGPMQKCGYNEIELIKTFWATAAIEQGCVFKAIIGMKIV